MTSKIRMIQAIADQEVSELSDEMVRLLAIADAEIAEHKARAAAKDAEIADLQRTFDLQWEADQRAIKRWQEAHPGSELTWPDRADMVVWLMGQLDAAPATTLRLWQCAKAEIALLKADFQNASDAADAYCAEIGELRSALAYQDKRWRRATENMLVARRERDKATEQRDRAMKVVEAARRWRKWEWGSASSEEIRNSRRHTADELDEDDANMALIDELAALDAEAAAETAPSLPETPEA